AAADGAGNAADALSKDLAADPKQALLEALKQAQGMDASGQAADSTKAQQSVAAGGENANGSAGSLADLVGKMSGNEALREIAKGLDELLSAEKTPENVARLAKAATLLQGKDMKDLLGGELSKQWKMTPEMVAGKEDVQEFYTKLRIQTGDLARAAQQALGSDNALTQQAGGLQQNVDFMNQLNQTAAYIQLPLQLAGEDAHGELYVYTNKKSLAENDGKVSAFLHLDMDNLGPVDVYVAMENAKVSTNFYLADDAMIDFISENIHILDERLADRGYNMTCKVSMKESKEPTNVMEEVIEDHKDGFLIGSKSFDVRA
ncbi:MAG: flagellar hook-length control protein FliK, partial [Lachnospiraceae bacterium]|nr:flagellar hook-length control protein FliK [Lachnospiraceae bacterium]